MVLAKARERFSSARRRLLNRSNLAFAYPKDAAQARLTLEGLCSLVNRQWPSHRGGGQSLIRGQFLNRSKTDDS